MALTWCGAARRSSPGSRTAACGVAQFGGAAGNGPYSAAVLRDNGSGGLQMDAEVYWLIWDGGCTFCANTVAWFGRLDRDRKFVIVPYDECPSPPMTPALRHEAERAIQVVARDGRRFSGGRAVLFVLAEVGWHRTLMRLAATPPLVWIVAFGYRFVANHRQLLSRFFFRNRP